MGGAESVANSNIRVVIGTKDLDIIKEKQKEHGGWNASMNECLTGPCKVIQSLGSYSIVMGPSGNVYRLNSQLIVKYKTSPEQETESFPTPIDEMDETFEEGEKVVLIKNIDMIKNFQKDHGGWCELMSLIIGEEVEIVKVMEDGDLYVSKLGMEWMINPKCIGSTNGNKLKEETLRKGSLVQISDDIEKIKQLQQNHGGWVNTMEFCAGKISKVESILPSGDVKVNVNGLRLVYNPLLLTTLDGQTNSVNTRKLSNASQGQMRRLSGFGKTELKKFAPGDKVRLIEDKNKIKRLQKEHGEWVSSIEFAMGKVGRVKSVFQNGDLRVKVCNQKLHLNPECVEATNSDCDPDPDLETIVSQLSQIISRPDIPDNSHESQEDETDVKTKSFFKALKMNNLNEVRNLLDSVGVNTFWNGVYPLMVAVSEGHTDLVRLLMERRANVNAKDNDGNTGLHLAVQGSQTIITDLLIKKGADVNAQNNDKVTPVMLAAVTGSRDILRLLVASSNADLDIGNADNDTALHLAVKHSQIHSVDVLLNAGANIKAVSNSQFTPYHLAALKGHERILEMFLKREGIRIVNSQKDDKYAAIHLAVFNNHEGCLQILLKYRADINIRNNKLQTALHIAVSQKHLKCVKMLVENNADIDVMDTDGDTPLHVAIRMHRMDIIKSSGNHLGMSEILQSIVSNRGDFDKPEDIAIYLMKKGARTDIKNNNDRTPLDLCDDSLKEKLSMLKTRKLSKEILLRTEVIPAPIPTQLPAQIPITPLCVTDNGNLDKSLIIKTKDEELKELRQKIRDMEDEKTCIICFDRPINVTFGCGHVACDVCANNLYDCHICRENIENKIRIYK